MRQQAQASVAEEAETAAPQFEADVEGHERARPIPRISIQAFCEEQATADVMQAASEDRRLAKAHVSVHMGGADAAVKHYQESPTPNLIIIESHLERDALIGQLERLAESCDAGTKVVVIGHANDVITYRELLKRGVSEYLVGPVTPLQLMEGLSNLYSSPDAEPVGTMIAFIGAKGGVGSSTICHNVAWSMSEHLKQSVCIADLDLAFGTAGLDFNQDPPQGIADALSSPERLDQTLLDRLLTRCSERLSLFSAPVMLDRDYNITADSCDLVLDVVRQTVPIVAVDVPHTWTPWVRQILMNADQIVITAQPDLANLRNVKNIVDLVKANRKNDIAPRLIINMAKAPKRPEIAIKEFAGGVGLEPTMVIDFDCESFGQAANNGQMLEEAAAKAKAAAQFRELAMILSNRRESKVEKKPEATGLGALLGKLKLKG